MKFTLALAALAASIPATLAYPITGADALHCRSGPGTSYPIQKTLRPPQDIKIQCQEPGTVVNGVSLWDKTQFGCYVSDYYVKTGTGNYVAPRCNSGGSSSACTGLNDAGINLIKEFEGFVPRPAPDPIGLPTVGYGHLCQTKGCGEVKYSFPLTTATATALLKDDLPKYTSCLAKALNGKPKLNKNQWAALASWTFNVGCGNMKSSSLITRLNAGQNPNTVATEELPKWKLAGGKVLPGLVRRRAAEVKLFKTANSSQGYPKCA
nr:GH24 muramidase [Mortierella sp. ZY002]